MESDFVHEVLMQLCCHRIEVLHSVGCESLGYFYSGSHTRQGMPVTHGFPHGHYVGTEALPVQLEGPEVTPHAAETCLHLVCHEHSTCCAHVPVGWGGGHRVKCR